ncbi:MAG: DnaB-like helicase C-terminal domain-containing protein, partial [Methanomassiliicoccales archaeon]
GQKPRLLYSYIYKYYQKYGAMLTRTAIDSLMDSDGSMAEEDRATLRMYWDKVYNNSEVDIDEDYSNLRDKINARYVQWQAIKILQDRVDVLAKASGGQIVLVKELQESFNKIDNLESDSYCVTMSIEEGMEKAIAHIKDRREHPERQSGIMSGIRGIDEAYNGFVPGSYTVISGMIGGGKTTLMMNIAFNASKAGYTVIYVSMEKEAVPFYERLLSLHWLLDYNRIKRGGTSDTGLNDYYYNKYIEAAKDLRENIKPRFDCIQLVQGTKVSRILADIDRIRLNMKINLIVVDYLGVVGHESHHSTRPDLDLADSSQRLQAYGRRHRIAMITGLQLKNASTKDIRGKAKKISTEDDLKGLEVNTEDLAGSQKVIADADNCISVVMNNDKPPSKVFCYVTKARDNEGHKLITLDFDGRIGRISDPEVDPNQITGVDDLVYDPDKARKLMSDDGLFTEEIVMAMPSPSSLPSEQVSNDLLIDSIVPSSQNIENPAAQNDDDYIDNIKEHISGASLSHPKSVEPQNKQENKQENKNELSESFDPLFL